MVRLLSSALIVAALAGCTATVTSSPVPGILIDGVHVLCDAAPATPSPLTCRDALKAAMPASTYAASDVDFAEFHLGAYCAPGAPCASAPTNMGYVVVHPTRPGGARPIVLIQLSADASRTVMVDYSRPFPSGAP